MQVVNIALYRPLGKIIAWQLVFFLGFFPFFVWIGYDFGDAVRQVLSILYRPSGPRVETSAVKCR